LSLGYRGLRERLIFWAALGYRITRARPLFE
jgi:hypothetical protein